MTEEAIGYQLSALSSWVLAPPETWRRHSCLPVRDSSRPSFGTAPGVPERRDESRRCRHECLRHIEEQQDLVSENGRADAR